MWWTIFTIADLYIGLIVLDAIKPSVPLNKLNLLRIARRAVLSLIAVCGIVLLTQLALRFGWLRP